MSHADDTTEMRYDPAEYCHPVELDVSEELSMMTLLADTTSMRTELTEWREKYGVEAVRSELLDALKHDAEEFSLTGFRLSPSGGSALQEQLHSQLQLPCGWNSGGPKRATRLLGSCKKSLRSRSSLPNSPVEAQEGSRSSPTQAKRSSPVVSRSRSHTNTLQATNEVRCLLEEWLGFTQKLDFYVNTLLQNGYDTFEMLAELTEADLLELGMLKPHARKVLKHVSELPTVGMQDTSRIVQNGNSNENLEESKSLDVPTEKLLAKCMRPGEADLRLSDWASLNTPTSRDRKSVV